MNNNSIKWCNIFVYSHRLFFFFFYENVSKGSLNCCRSDVLLVNNCNYNWACSENLNVIKYTIWLQFCCNDLFSSVSRSSMKLLRANDYNVIFRVNIVWMWHCGLSVRDIANNTGVSTTTVYRWIHRWNREGNVWTKPRSCPKPLKLYRINLWSFTVQE